MVAPATQIRLAAVKPLVRYVDEHQAVIETWFQLADQPSAKRMPRQVDVRVELMTDNGFYDETCARVALNDNIGVIRLDVAEPSRWWPAGMGDQSLYSLHVVLERRSALQDEWIGDIGLTSVRHPEEAESWLLVNGQPINFDCIIPIDRIDERALLPVSGNTLMIVRDHYGQDLLYNAADRAGILVIQAIPIHPEGQPEREVAAQIHRLSTHPCLAGWYVGHQGRITDELAEQIRKLDPSRQVFRDVPDSAA